MKALFTARLKRLETLLQSGPSLIIVCGQYGYWFYFDRIYPPGLPPIQGRKVIIHHAVSLDARLLRLPPGAASVSFELASDAELVLWQNEYDLLERIGEIDHRALSRELPEVSEEEKAFVMQSKYFANVTWKSYDEYVSATIEHGKQMNFYFRDSDWPVYEAPVRPPAPVSQAEQAAPAPSEPELTPAEITEAKLDRHFKLQLVRQRQQRLQKTSGYYK